MAQIVEAKCFEFVRSQLAYLALFFPVFCSASLCENRAKVPLCQVAKVVRRTLAGSEHKIIVLIVLA